MIISQNHQRIWDIILPLRLNKTPLHGKILLYFGFVRIVGGMDMKSTWSWVDYVLAAFRLFMYVTGILYFLSNPSEAGTSSGVIIFLFIICMVMPQLFWRPGYIHPERYVVTELLLSGSFYLYFTFYLQVDIQSSLLLMPALGAGYLSTKAIIQFAPLCLVALSLCMFRFDIDIATYILQLFIMSMMYGFGFSFRKILNTQMKIRNLLAENEKKNKLIESQNRTLEQYSHKVEELTLQTERNRLAAELHDTIGHIFTSVIVGMDAVNVLIEHHPQKAQEQLARLRDVTTNGLDVIRQQIHGIADGEEHLSTSSMLEQIKQEFAEYTSTEVSWNVEGKEYEVAKPLRLVLSRCLQEGLTNAKRHGNASKIDISLTFLPYEVQLEIKDNGSGSDSIEFGFGLKGMSDRLMTYKGTLEVKSQLGVGTILTCVIPTRGGEE